MAEEQDQIKRRLDRMLDGINQGPTDEEILDQLA